MYLIDNWYKFVICLALIFGFQLGSEYAFRDTEAARTEASVGQLDEGRGVAAQKKAATDHYANNQGLLLGWAAVALLCPLVFLGDIRRMAKKFSTAGCLPFLFLLLGASSAGCSRKPFEPVKLEVIGSNEEAFLIPLTGDGKKQTSANNEEYLKKNLVYTKQVQIPQQWRQKGYDGWGSYNGEWIDAATLIKVDKSPATREWTADPATGTSKKNEAIWVMTSDQVEFSTGWTVTARISGRDDAVKFLHNYPNGSLVKVLDSEVRAKLQAEFGLEVTDLPMDELRKNATPHIRKITKSIGEFFKDRGVTVTNLGITGGFVYKDKSIVDTMVKVFNAEQQKTMAIAATNAQLEKNKAVILEATGKADAILKTRKAEADGIKLVADARLYEIEKAAKQQDVYLQLKRLELQKELLGRWDGSFPRYYLGGGGAGSNPSMLLQLPPLEATGKK